MKESTMKRLHGLFSACVILALITLFAAGEVFAGKTTFVSSDFNSYSFNPTLWTLVNPRGDGGISMTGTGTANAAISIKATSELEHNLWTDGDNTVRILQTATNTDFNMEVKFLSGLAGGTFEAYTAQGVLIEESATSKLEFCFTTATDDSVHAYAAGFIGGFGSPNVKVNKKMAALGQGPLWMRISRTGSTWKFMYSLNGTSFDTAVEFSQALTMTKVGPFVLNAGTKKADFSAVVDYFHNLDSIKAADDSQPAPPDTIAAYIHGVRVQEFASNAIRIAWNTDKLTDGRLDYGTTLSYGSYQYALDVAFEHSLLVTDLIPATTYNYRVLAGDQGSRVSQTGNYTKATLATVADVSSKSDAFGDASLNTSIWTVVDPRGDATVAMVNDQLAIAVPSGVSHDLWDDGDNITRVSQDLSYSDNREFIARFNTGVSAAADNYRFEGMVFQESATRLIRFDFLNDGSNTRAFAATLWGIENPYTRFNVVIGPASMAPLQMRVRQYGALWTMDYSFDGTSWTQAGSFWDFMAPTKVGVSTGNSGTNPPDFTSLTEFFQGALPAKTRLSTPANDSTYLPIPVQLTWTVTIGATGYHVQVAKDSLFTVMVANDSLLTSPQKNLTGLQSDTKYYWRVKGKNSKGSGLYSAVWKFTTVPGIPGAPSLLAPANGSSNQPVSSTLRWGKVASAIAYHLQVGTDSTFATALVVNDSTIVDTVGAVSGLLQNTKYFWRVRTKNVSGTGPFSTVWNFRTVVPIPSGVTLLLPAMNTLVTKDTVLFVWRKGEPAVTKYTLVYAPDSVFTFGITDSSITDTTKIIRSIPNNARYFWKVRAGNASGWGPYSEVRAYNVLYVSVAQERELPKEFVLSQNYPNPFNPATRIEYGVPNAGHVTLEVYNLLGEKVATLVDGEKQPGYHLVSFDAARFASGVYLYRLVTDKTALMKKMILVK
jgi:hypothetical protein